MKVLIDINVLLDIALDRAPWADEAAMFLDAVASGRVSACIAPHTLPTAFYLIAKVKDRQAAATAISEFLRLVDVVPVDGSDFLAALALGMRDFEDAVQARCALKAGAEFIVTRNVKDFLGVGVRAEPPGQILAMLRKPL